MGFVETLGRDHWNGTHLESAAIEQGTITLDGRPTKRGNV
jgi:hypothetical protein